MPHPLTETWKWVVGFEGRYEISDLGRIRSWLAWNGTELPRLMKPCDNNRYSQVYLQRPDGSRKQGVIHQLVLEAFVGPRPDGMQAAHLDDNRFDNRLINLAWKTRQENILDRSRNGRTAVGKRNGSYKHGLYVGPNRKRGVPGAPRKKYIRATCKRGHQLPPYEPGRTRKCCEPECREARRFNALGR